VAEWTGELAGGVPLGGWIFRFLCDSGFQLSLFGSEEEAAEVSSSSSSISEGQPAAARQYGATYLLHRPLGVHGNSPACA